MVPAPRAASMPLSLQQEAMWQDCGAAQFTDVHASRIIGPIDAEIYEDCLRHLVERHEILRTTFGVVDGRPAQIVHPSGPTGFSFLDLSAAADPQAQADRILREAASRPIDLGALPIQRYLMIKIADADHRLARIHNFMILDGFAARTLEEELASLYEARQQGREPPLPRRARLHYADYAAWQRQVLAGPHADAVTAWWRAMLSTAPPSTRLPFQRLLPRTGFDAGEGVLRWMPEEQVGQRLDEIARGAGTTSFVIRLAAFAALIGDLGGHPTVVINTFFDNRHRVEAQSIVGRFVNWVPLVLPYDAGRTFLQWLRTVHDRVFETLAHSELPLSAIAQRLRALGVEAPGTQITFMLSRDHSEQRFGGLVVSDDGWSSGTMPQGCLFYVDARMPQNCQVRFDARLYHREDMRALVDRYLRLLEAASREPSLPLARLQAMLGAKPPRLARAGIAATLYRIVEPWYASSPWLQAVWRRAKRLLSRAGGKSPQAG
jgi:hypothetical protein